MHWAFNVPSCTYVFCLPEDNQLCMSLEDRGASYRGNVSYSQHYRRCIPWEKAQHCDVNPFAQQ